MTRMDPSERYDPDEQAILRLMHENMKDWDKTNFIDTDNLRKQYYEIDTQKRFTLTQRQVRLNQIILKKLQLTLVTLNTH